MDTYGFSESEWSAALREAKDILAARAKLRGMIPYSDLASRIKSVHLEAHDQRLFHLLGDISKAEDAAGHGMLSVIVVHKQGDMQPGPGFFELAQRLERDTSDVLECWVKELKRVHAFWSKQ
jgi:molybdopterin synthase catalytic subunit